MIYLLKEIIINNGKYTENKYFRVTAERGILMNRFRNIWLFFCSFFFQFWLPYDDHKFARSHETVFVGCSKSENHWFCCCEIFTNTVNFLLIFLFNVYHFLLPYSCFFICLNLGFKFLFLQFSHFFSIFPI